MLPLLLVVSGCKGGELTEQSKGSVPTVAGIPWDKPFNKNIEVEEVYKKSISLPDHHTLCVPVKKYFCDGTGCKDLPPTVFDLLGGSIENATISRCDEKGCDSYAAAVDESGEFKNMQPVDPKGFIIKMSYNTIDKKYVEMATFGLDVYLSYGYCLYRFELPKIKNDN